MALENEKQDGSFIIDIINDMKYETEQVDLVENENNSDQGSTTEFGQITENEISEYGGTKIVEHVLIHNKFDCPFCDKHFDNNAKFGRHISRIHSQRNTNKKVQCPICQKTYQDYGKFSRHLVIHTGIKDFECHICHRRFNRKDHLAKHVTVHAPSCERRHKCPYCNKGFVENNILQSHLNTHTGNKPYKCGICGKGFFSDNTLKPHLVVHSEKKPFLCPECGKAFRRNTTLKHHMNTHTLAKPYHCHVCNTSFTTKQTLVCHARIHTGEMPYHCSKCNREFMRRDVYKYHINRKTDCTLDNEKVSKNKKLKGSETSESVKD